MSEHTKERLVVVEGPLGAIETVSGQAFAQVEQVINDPLHIQRQANAKDIASSYNACLAMSDPEADVKALVEALDAALAYLLHSPLEGALDAYRQCLAALARLRREP